MKDIFSGIIVLIMAVWCLGSLLRKNTLGKLDVSKRMLAVVCIFFAILVCFTVQLIGQNNEVSHTFLYIGLFLLPFCVSFIRQESKYYMQLFLGAYILVYLSILLYIITGTPSLIGVESLLADTSKLIPSLLLAIAVSAFLYISEDNSKIQNIYLGISAFGMVELFLYGDMVAYMILLLYLMCLQFLRKPTARFIKKNLILLFAFAFCASNAPLITYFGVKGYSRQFDLEYSIYIDLVIAVVGLIISKYWERLPKDHDEDHTVMLRFSKWFKGSIIFVLSLLAISFIFGSKGNNLSGTIGGKAIAGFSVSLWNAVSKSNGELWHVLSVYGAVGVFVLMVMGLIIFSRIYKAWKSTDISEAGRGYVLIAILFLVQSFFYPYTASSTPAYLIFLGFALGAARKVLQEAHEEKIDFSTLHPVEESDVFGIWVPRSVKEALKPKQEPVEEQEGGILFIRRIIPQVCAITASLFASALVIMIFLVLYRVFIPAGSSVMGEPLVQVALAHRQEQLLAMEEASDGGEESILEAGAEGEEVLEAGEAGAGNELSEAVDGDSKNDVAKASTEANNANPDAGKDADEAGISDGTDGNAKEGEAAEEGEGEAESTAEYSQDGNVENIEAGISHGDYRIYDPNASYRRVNDDVTGRKGMINLRSIPSLENGSVVVHALGQGESAHRTGIGENGWSRVVYNGRTLYAVTEYLAVVTPQEQPQEEVAQEPEAAKEQQAQEAPKEQEQKAASEDANKQEAKPKKPNSYTVLWSDDNKKITIWSAGVLQGTMTVTDADGKVLNMTGYGDHLAGSGKEQKRYYNISVNKGDSEITINVDGGFVAAIKDMGYSGLYFNKAIHNW